MGLARRAGGLGASKPRPADVGPALARPPPSATLQPYLAPLPRATRPSRRGVPRVSGAWHGLLEQILECDPCSGPQSGSSGRGQGGKWLSSGSHGRQGAALPMPSTVPFVLPSPLKSALATLCGGPLHPSLVPQSPGPAGAPPTLPVPSSALWLCRGRGEERERQAVRGEEREMWRETHMETESDTGRLGRQPRHRTSKHLSRASARFTATHRGGSSSRGRRAPASRFPPWMSAAVLPRSDCHAGTTRRPATPPLFLLSRSRQLCHRFKEREGTGERTRPFPPSPALWPQPLHEGGDLPGGRWDSGLQLISRPPPRCPPPSPSGPSAGSAQARLPEGGTRWAGAEHLPMPEAS